ncbi:hypothetical protein H8959_015867 [Pygathrix nigripes]
MEQPSTQRPREMLLPQQVPAGCRGGRNPEDRQLLAVKDKKSPQPNVGDASAVLKPKLGGGPDSLAGPSFPLALRLHGRESASSAFLIWHPPDCMSLGLDLWPPDSRPSVPAQAHGLHNHYSPRSSVFRRHQWEAINHVLRPLFPQSTSHPELAQGNTETTSGSGAALQTMRKAWLPPSRAADTSPLTPGSTSRENRARGGDPGPAHGTGQHIQREQRTRWRPRPRTRNQAPALAALPQPGGAGGGRFCWLWSSKKLHVKVSGFKAKESENSNKMAQPRAVIAHPGGFHGKHKSVTCGGVEAWRAALWRDALGQLAAILGKDNLGQYVSKQIQTQAAWLIHVLLDQHQRVSEAPGGLPSYVVTAAESELVLSDTAWALQFAVVPTSPSCLPAAG